MKKISIKNWIIPDKVTPIDKLLATFNSKLNANNNEKMSTIFKAIGAAAAAANLLFVFKIPASIEDKLTKSKKGKVILVNSTAKLNFSLSAKKPGAIR